jgi:ATP-binding cassette subfamily B protein
VLLLDEATAAVDASSDAAFRAGLRDGVLSQGGAVLSIAHRLSTAREADRVVLLEAGRIVEEGSPEELVRRGGRFAALVELESAGWDWQRAAVMAATEDGSSTAAEAATGAAGAEA